MKRLAVITGLISMSLLLGCASNQASTGSDSEHKKIMNHCTLMADFGYIYQTNLDKGEKNNVAFNNSEKLLINHFHLQKSDKLDMILMGYSAFINMAPGYKPNTMKYYTLAQCLTLHGLHKRLPLDRGPKEKKIKQALSNCENTAKTDDDLGACILNTLRPMAESF